MPIAIAMGAAFLYTAPKFHFRPLAWLSRIQVAKTLFLAFTWMYVTTLLPMLVDEIPLKAPQLLFCASRLFFIYAICVLFDHRDREDDRRQRIRSLPTIMNDTQVRWLFLTTLIGYLLFTLALTGYFSTIVIICLVTPGLLAAMLFRRAMERPTDLLFYFVLDGLMALSSLLTLFLPI
jgi:4-hydroxybenzoate polyprenyltransferase